jgi:hypothetical protein
LIATKVTQNGKPVAGVVVRFAVVPGSTGAAGTLRHNQVATAANGTASVGLTANSKAGAFMVTARIGAGLTLTFDLKNT